MRCPIACLRSPSTSTGYLLGYIIAFPNHIRYIERPLPAYGYCWSIRRVLEPSAVLKPWVCAIIPPAGYKQSVLTETKPASADLVRVAAPLYGDSGIWDKRGV